MILCNICQFQGNVSIVDTPGVGGKDQEVEANMMLNYIHHALAIVFVLNVANAGGIQDDRVIFFLLQMSLLLEMSSYDMKSLNISF